MEHKSHLAPNIPHVFYEKDWNVQSPQRVFSNPRPTKHRAWEREPRSRHPPQDSSCASNNNKPRVIWKRHDLLSAPSQHHQHSSTFLLVPCTKALKRVKLRETSDSALIPRADREAVSQWDQRNSSLPHKSPSHRNTTQNLPAETENVRLDQDRDHDQEHWKLSATTDAPAASSQQHINDDQQAINCSVLGEGGSDKLPADAFRRILRPRSSLLKRRKTDFGSLQALASSPTRKRRLTDTVKPTTNDLSLVQLQIEPWRRFNGFDRNADSQNALDTRILDGHSTPETDKQCENKYSNSHQAENTGSCPAISSEIVSSAGIDDQNLPHGIDLVIETPAFELLVQSDQDASTDTIASCDFQQAKSSTTFGDNEVKVHELETPNKNTSIENLSFICDRVVSASPQEASSASDDVEEHAVDQLSNLTEQSSGSTTALENTENKSTITVVLNDNDTDILHDFLSRAKASKAAKIANHSSVLNRRDSDVVKNALASPRKALDVVDANSPSPRKPQKAFSGNKGNLSPSDSENQEPSEFFDKLVEQTGELYHTDSEQPVNSHQPTRRSKRNVGAPPTIPARSSSYSATPTNTISVRLQDQPDTVTLKKTEAQELALQTRNNTRRNKGGALPARLMLMKLKDSSDDDGFMILESMDAPAKVKWNDDLVSYFREPNIKEAQSLQSAKQGPILTKEDSKPRARRAKMLGAMNGTPARQRTRDRELNSHLLDDDTAELQIHKLFAPENSSNETKVSNRELDRSKNDSIRQQSENEIKPEPIQQIPSVLAQRRLTAPAKAGKVVTQTQAWEPMKTRHSSSTSHKLTTVTDDTRRECLLKNTPATHTVGAAGIRPGSIATIGKRKLTAGKASLRDGKR